MNGTKRQKRYKYREKKRHIKNGNIIRHKEENKFMCSIRSKKENKRDTKRGKKCIQKNEGSVRLRKGTQNISSLTEEKSLTEEQKREKGRAK